MKKNNRKLVIIAIDGGNFEVMNSFFKKNLLPNINSLKNRCILKSTIPPATAVAWASFATGNLPGKTEIYDFTILDEDSWKVNFINRTRLQGKPIWKYLDESNLRSCFINMPVTYPPDKINGVMISGIETPSKMHNYVYPIELKKILKKIGYEIEVSGLKSEREDIIKEALYILDKRLETVRYLIKKNFDFFFILFRESDITQHFAWNKYPVEEVYKKIDEFVGEVKKSNDVIVMSDHGFEKIDKAFNANAWLEKEGLLKTKIKGKRLLSSVGVTQKRIFWVLEHLKLNFLIRVVPRSLAKKIPAEKINLEEALSTGAIEFDKTKAIAKRAVKTAQIFLNTKERGGIIEKNQEDQLKNEIKEKLIKFFERNKIKVIVQTKEELYGKNAKYAPDITLYIEESGYDTYCFFSQDKKIFVEPIENQDGEHNLPGIIFTNLNLNLKDARIIDLAPTILDYFGIKKEKFDGRSLL